jgi:hypothetical protein
VSSVSVSFSCLNNLPSSRGRNNPGRCWKCPRGIPGMHPLKKAFSSQLTPGISDTQRHQARASITGFHKPDVRGYTDWHDKDWQRTREGHLPRPAAGLFVDAAPFRAPIVVARRNYWQDYHAQLVMVGKHFCRTREPRCAECPLRPLMPKGVWTRGK